MPATTRRQFLGTVGRGALAATLGGSLAADLGLALPLGEDDGALEFGALEPLVARIQESPADALQRALVGRLDDGLELRTIVAACALANARTFGGEDYVGYHGAMALVPAWEMSRELPEGQRALPVLKVVHRNARRIQECGGRRNEVLAIPPAPGEVPVGELRTCVRERDVNGAEGAFSTAMEGGPDAAFEDLQQLVQDDVEVHLVVLARRSWDLLDLTGREHAQTMLRQVVRFSVDREESRKRKGWSQPAIRRVLPRLLDAYELEGRTPGTRRADDAWIEEAARAMYGTNREEAAELVAAALAEGVAPASVGEAMGVASARLVQHDPGRNGTDRVHGASVGVHASDSAHAWIGLAGTGGARTTFASLIVGAYHTAGQSGRLNREPLGHDVEVHGDDSAALLRELAACIEVRDQARACAIVRRYGEIDGPLRPLLDLLLQVAVRVDGALHAEKYYRTTSELFAATRPAFRWEHMVSLARVSASAQGEEAPGLAEARRLLRG